MHTPDDDAEIRTILKSQYRAALAMLRDAIERCPDEIWEGGGHTNACWQVAYHALFFAHLYGETDYESFRPWTGHRADNQYPDAIPGPADPASALPLLPKPYTKAEVLAYWKFCDERIDGAVEATDVRSSSSGFSWYPVPKLEHQIINLRHIQHHAAQLADRVRTAADVGVAWVGARRPKPAAG